MKYIALEQQRPKCTDTAKDHAYADMILDSDPNDEDAKQAVSLLKERVAEGKNTTLLAFRGGLTEEDLDEFIKMLEQSDSFVRRTVNIAYNVPGATLLWLSVQE